MPTANFNLPLIDASSPISIVNDMNALATATDSAMTQFSTSSSLDAIRTLANNANAVANQANTTAEAAQSTANAAATEATAANSAAQSANTLATAANTNANSAMSQAQQVSADLRKYFNFSVFSRYSPSYGSTTDGDKLTLVFNQDKTLFKLYGRIRVAHSVTNTAVPGLSGVYGLQLSNNSPFGALNSGYQIVGLGTTTYQNTSSNTRAWYTASIAIGSDGNIYLDPITNTRTYNDNLYTLVYDACILTNGNFGDVGGSGTGD